MERLHNKLLSAEWTVGFVNKKLLVVPYIFKLDALVDDLKLTLTDKALQHSRGHIFNLSP
jgi:hypothetical protein